MGHPLEKPRAHAEPAAPEASAPRPMRRWTRWLTGLLGLAVIVLLAWAARKVDWHEVGDALLKMPPGTLLAALGVAALSHLVYSTYDLMGRHWTGHRLPWQRVMQTTFVSYAFNLNLGSLVGGIAFRYRLYSRLGLRKGLITQILALSLTTNWLGYAAVAGAVFLFGWLTPPPDWHLSRAALPWVGGVLWLVVGLYVWLCGGARGRHMRIRGQRISLPSARLAALQVGLATLNWLLISSVVWLLLKGAVPYTLVIGALLAGAIAGVLTHVPAGVGVIETVFVALLSSRVPTGQLLAALLSYRAIYYLLPLLCATGLYFVLEARANREDAALAAAKNTVAGA
ncbi:MAG: YbhN family protein [Aquabacterium sp.]